jgi:hypothetical protein
MKTLNSFFLFIAVTVLPLRADEFSSWEWLHPNRREFF